ncbi:MAG: DUF5132 domain-containing protein [Pseudonocardia sp.]
MILPVATPLLKPFLVGIVAAPVVVAVVKPLLRGVVKTSVALALEAKKLAAEAGEEFQDVAAEVSADMAAKERMASEAAGKTGRSQGAASTRRSD